MNSTYIPAITPYLDSMKNMTLTEQMTKVLNDSIFILKKITEPLAWLLSNKPEIGAILFILVLLGAFLLHKNNQLSSMMSGILWLLIIFIIIFFITFIIK